MKNLDFSTDGICRIRLAGVPQPAEIEELIENYVINVELLPYRMRLIYIDISELVHMNFPARQVFSEFLMQASKHYDDKVNLVIVGGTLNLRRFLALFCKSIGLGQRSHIFEEQEEANRWVEGPCGVHAEFETMDKEAS